MPLTVELRDKSLLTREVARAMTDAGVPFCFAFHPSMPSLSKQLGWALRHGLIERGGAPLVARLMLPPGHRYEDRRGALAPFDRIAEVEEPMRREVVEILAHAIGAERDLYVIVNNKAEGSAPLTIRAIAERVAKL